MKSIVLIIIAVFVLLVAVVWATLVANKARFLEAPGLATRLSVYLGQNQAETADQHAFAELRTPLFERDAAGLYQAVLAAADELGWHIEQQDAQQLQAHLVVSTPLLGFKDDVDVRVSPAAGAAPTPQSTLWLRSRSRVGKADFGANAGHIQRLIAAIEQRLQSGVLR